VSEDTGIDSGAVAYDSEGDLSYMRDRNRLQEMWLTPTFMCKGGEMAKKRDQCRSLLRI
jgi:hypothetical protein